MPTGTVKQRQFDPIDLAQGFPTDPIDVRWGSPIWPEKIERSGFRPHQMVAWVQVMQHYANGADVVILHAPTGSGKTVIGEGTRRLLGVERGLYVANTKGLQDQCHADFSYSKVLKGRSNYPTLDKPELFQNVNMGANLSAADCIKRYVSVPFCSDCNPNVVSDDAVAHCNHCHPAWQCPYRQAKVQALSAPLAITNTAYFIAEANGPGEFTELPFVIIDECDTLESIMMGQIEVVVSKRDQERYEIPPPERKTAVKEGTTPRKKQTWDQWVREIALPAYQLGGEALGDPEDVKKNKELAHVVRQMDRLRLIERELLEGNAVYDDDRGEIRFRPVRVDRRGKEMIWQHADKWLLMSATILDPQEFVDSVGITDAGLNWEIVNVPSTFPKENRPIVVKRIADNTYNNRDVAWPAMVNGVERVLKKHSTDRILVHTVSYEFTKYLREKLNTHRRLLTYHQARDRDATLEEFRRTPNAVLLAPSMDRGVDLPEDDCRVVVITKMPYMSTRDPQVSARLYQKDGQLWYLIQTLRSLVQMSGRATRSATDTSITYILDEQFMKVWKDGKHLLPAWWKEALDWSGGGL